MVIIMENAGELLEYLYTLGRMDGYALRQFQCVEDDYDTIKWFEGIVNVAEKLNIRIPNYNEDYEVWEKPIALNDVVKTIIKTKIYQMIEE